MSQNHNVTVSFWGGTGSVTGANFLLEGEWTKVLIDCGLTQGERFAEAMNREPFPYDPASVRYLLVTHAHIDHIGRIPKLVRDGFSGTIVSTPETREISELMFYDALSILKAETPQGEDLLYEEKDILRALSLWTTIPYHQTLGLGDEFEVLLKDAGHILGSAMIEICKSPLEKGVPPSSAGRVVTTPALADSAPPFTKGEITPGTSECATPFTKGDAEPTRKRKIVFTGDLGNSPSPLLRDTEPIEGASYLVMESVYGDRNHEGIQERRERLAMVIREAVGRRGVLLIPCFSLEKTQVLLHEMNDLLLEKKIPQVPVYLDSPLAIKVTEIYRSYSSQFNEHAREEIERGDDIFKFPNLLMTPDARTSSAIVHQPNPKIIIAGSGMSAGGRILGHEGRYLSDPSTTILFVGYQAAGSLGRQIQEGVKKVKIGDGEVIVRATMETIIGYSSHKDSEHLLEFVAQSAETLEKVFITMGEPKASLFLAQRIRDYIGVDAVAPARGEKVTLEM